jgi:predicted NAD-dependent protein-ADP-ribosyltransferase YbiA (DUF1768 family)
MENERTPVSGMESASFFFSYWNDFQTSVQKYPDDYNHAKKIHDAKGPGAALRLSRDKNIKIRGDWHKIKVDVVRNYILGANPTNMQLDDIYCLPEVCTWGTTCAERTH